MLAVAGMIGCGSSTAGPPDAGDTVVANIAASPNDQPFFSLAQTLQLEVVATNAAGNTVAAPAVTWSTNNPVVLEVTTAGVMIGLSVGTATITATHENMTSSVDFRVIDISGTWTGGEAPDMVSYTITQDGTSVTGTFQSKLGFPPITDVNSGTLTGRLKFGTYSHELEVTAEDACILEISGAHEVTEAAGGALVLTAGPPGFLSSPNCSTRGTINFVTLRKQ